MQGIHKSWKALGMAIAVSGTACCILWVLLDLLDLSKMAHVPYNTRSKAFWLILFVLLAAGFYLNVSRTKIDD